MSKAAEIFDAWKDQASEYFKGNPGVTEQYAARELTSFMSSKAFTLLENNFPEQASKLKAAFAGRDWQSRILIGGLSLIFKNRKIKEMTPPMVATLISDVMSEITKWLTATDAGADGTMYPGLEGKLMSVSPESLGNYIQWQKSLNDEELASVCAFLSTKSVEEIDALLQLDITTRNDVMSAFLRLRYRPKQIASGVTSTEKTTPLLSALRRMKGGLQITHDRMVNENTGTD